MSTEVLSGLSEWRVGLAACEYQRQNAAKVVIELSKGNKTHRIKKDSCGLAKALEESFKEFVEVFFGRIDGHYCLADVKIRFGIVDDGSPATALPVSHAIVSFVQVYGSGLSREEISHSAILAVDAAVLCLIDALSFLGSYLDDLDPTENLLDKRCLSEMPRIIG